MPSDLEVESESGGRRFGGRLTALAVLIGIVVLVVRVVDLRHSLNATLVNPELVQAVMQTGSNGQVEFDTSANIFANGAPTGLQARALSKLAQAKGLTTTAELWLIYGLADRPSSFLSQFELCFLYWNDGQRTRAREACRGTYASARYWLNQGYLADQALDLEEALAYYEMATAIDPDLVEAWQAMGRTLFALNRYSETVTAYERVMVLDQIPDSEVYEALGWAYLKLNNLTMARDVLNRGLLVFPDRRPYYLAMADTYRVEGDLGAADGWYIRLLQRWPFDVQALAGRGDLAVASGRLNDAIRYYQEAVDNQPQSVGYWLNLASTASARGNVDLATEAYQRAMALAPDNPSVLLQVGRFFVETDRIDEATEIFEHILALQPDNREAADQLAALVNP